MFKIPPLLCTFSYIFAYIFNTYCTCQTNWFFRSKWIFSRLYGSDECSVFSFVNLSIQTSMCFCFAIFYSIKTLILWFPTTKIRIPVGSSDRFIVICPSDTSWFLSNLPCTYMIYSDVTAAVVMIISNVVWPFFFMNHNSLKFAHVLKWLHINRCRYRMKLNLPWFLLVDALRMGKTDGRYWGRSLSALGGGDGYSISGRRF